MTSPEEVCRSLAGDIGDGQLQRLLKALRTSGEWTVFNPLVSAQGRVMQLFHHATGKSIYIHTFASEGTTWRLSSK
jgi:hypothetical protein